MIDYFDKTKANSLIFCHRGALGDFILTLPSLFLAKKLLPDMKFIGIGKPEHLKLAAEFNLCDKIINSESAHLLSFFESADISMLPEPAKFAILWLKNHHHLLNNLSEKNIKTLLINPFPPNNTHIGKYYFSQISNFLAPEKIFLIENFLFRAIISSKKKEKQIALIHPGSGSKNKNFAPEFYLQLAVELDAIGFSPYFLFGPVEIEHSLFKKFPLEKSIFPANCIELKELVSSASLFIGNDSGPSHLSAFLGIKTITLFKNSNPAIWHPLGINAIYINKSDLTVTEFLSMRKVREFLNF